MSNTEHYFIIKGTAVHREHEYGKHVVVKFEIDHEMTGAKFGNTPIYDVANDKWIGNDDVTDDDLIMSELATMVDEYVGIVWKVVKNA